MIFLLCGLKPLRSLRTLREIKNCKKSIHKLFVNLCNMVFNKISICLQPFAALRIKQVKPVGFGQHALEIIQNCHKICLSLLQEFVVSCLV
jgi:hypothetical protein